MGGCACILGIFLCKIMHLGMLIKARFENLLNVVFGGLNGLLFT
jgi:hypothetical protein